MLVWVHRFRFQPYFFDVVMDLSLSILCSILVFVYMTSGGMYVSVVSSI